MEYYLAIKRNEMHVTTYRSLEKIMLSELSQLQKTTYYMIPSISKQK